MANSKDFIAYLLDNLQAIGRCEARAMFGGHGLFHGGLMFAIVIDDQLYFKADATTAPQFDEQGLERFSYMKKDRLCHINYYQAPEACLDDNDELLAWAQQAVQTARRAQKK